MASNIGKIEVEVEVQSGADKFWNGIRDSTNLFPKAFPKQYKSIEVVEGDDKSVGSVRLIKYAEGSPLVTYSKEKIESVDDANRTLVYSVIDGETLKYYKSFKGSLSVTPKGDGSLVKWCCEFERLSDEIPEPQIIKDFAVKNFKDLDAYLIGA
ncbi:MLP-like protein [Capsicum chinense]|uniref:MLP-like protein 423 n=1 Tax=Capsicum annuum TaxID=4072 RepID=UPI000C103A4B|nr:MLP-like protein 423 [Capsicum annuum]KAF3658016.1 MLP-like protein [Capsicum annuum]PHU02796.1 MLP-like protein [Capsicum chinense]